MSDTHQLHLELAWAIADARPREPDVKRLALAAGLTVPDLPMYARPIDTWIAVIAAAMRMGRLKELLAAIHDEVPTIVPASYQALVAQRGVTSAPAISLALEWRDLDDAEKQVATRTVASGKALPVTAIIRVFGSEKTPSLAWKWRPLLGRAAPVKVTPEGTPEPSFSVWRVDETFRARTLATSRLVAEATLGDLHDRASRTVSTEVGRWWAIAMVTVALVVAFVVLSRLPGLELAFGLSGAVVTIAMLLARGIDLRTLGPWWGLAVPERATIAAALTIAAVMLLPPLAFVVVENTTDEAVTLTLTNGTRISLAPGELRMVRRGHRGFTMQKSDSRLCICQSGLPNPKECECKPRKHHEGLEVVQIVCPAPRWYEQPLAMDGCKVAEKQDLEVLREASELVTGSSVRGDLRIRYPWPETLEDLHFTPDALTSDASVVPAGTDTPIVKLEGIRDDFTVKARASSFRIVFDDGGKLDCTVPPGPEIVSVRALAAPGATSVKAVAGGVSSTYKGNAPAPARFCARGDHIDAVELDLPPLQPGPLPRPMPLPQAPSPATVVYTRGTNTRFPSTCEEKVTTLVRVKARTGSPIRDQVITRAVPTNRANGDSWSIRGVASGNDMFGVVCDPPARETDVTFEGAGPTVWVLTDVSLKRKPPRAIAAFCQVDPRWKQHPVSAAAWPRVASCASRGNLICKPIGLDDLDADEAAKASECKQLCECRRSP